MDGLTVIVRFLLYLDLMMLFGIAAAFSLYALRGLERASGTFERAMAADDHPAALAALRWSLAVETLCATAILALVAWLGTLDPSGAA